MDARKATRQVWIITLTGARKEHIARNNEWGYPRDTTLCGKPCSSEYRKYSKGTTTISGKECSACLAKLTPKPRWRFNLPRSDKKIHFLLDDLQPACGQECATYGAGWIEMVTCDRCLAIAAGTGLRKSK